MLADTSLAGQGTAAQGAAGDSERNQPGGPSLTRCVQWGDNTNLSVVSHKRGTDKNAAEGHWAGCSFAADVWESSHW